MFKNRIFNLLVIASGSFLLVLGMFLMAGYKKQQKNSFVRELPPYKITAEQVKDLEINNLYLAGKVGDTIYFGHNVIKNLIVRYNFRGSHVSSVLLRADKSFYANKDATIQIDSSGIYVLDGSQAKISRARTTDYFLKESYRTPFFTAAIPLSQAFLFRGVNNKNTNVLMKQLYDRKSIVVKDHILKKQVDGIFCTDGLFFALPRYNRVFYVYHYRNQFIQMDTNLSVLSSHKTIDTNSRAKIKVEKIHSSNEMTLAAPPMLVNKQADVNENYLFIRSALKADNENNKINDNGAPIDVYDLTNGAYKFSFYLPDFAAQKLTDFKIYNKMLVALFGRYVYTFKLNF